MNTALWIIQLILAVMMFSIGFAKTFLPISALSKLSWTSRRHPAMVRLVGISELLIGAGLILPWWMGIMPFLTSIAAIALGVVMILAIREHIRHNEVHEIGKNFFILMLAVFVACGRFVALT